MPALKFAPRFLLAALLLASACNGTTVAPPDLSSLAPPPDLSTRTPPDLTSPPDLSFFDAGPCGRVCALPNAICDSASGQCVGCLLDGDCPDQTICVAKQCMKGCAADHSACGDGGLCDVDMGACRGCLFDRECSDPKLPVCDVASGICVLCSAKNDTCPAGTWCQQNGGVASCVMGCKGDVECQFMMGFGGASAACCNHACVNTATSLASCGGCNKACNLDACCSGVCIATKSDLNNCGACKNVCPINNNMPVCANSSCMSGACLPDFADCNGDASDGCEVNVKSDAQNCTACGKVCMVPNASPACLAGKCVIASCNVGYLNCNLMDGDGCEIHSAVDNNNCGACGTMCSALPHATSTCMTSRCVVLACAQGFGNCNKLDVDGCESALASDPLNCGMCGTICPVPANTIGTCTQSVCGVGGCKKNFGDCDQNPKNGCEANLLTDAKNCNGCGVACKVSEVCLNGKCAAGDYGGGIDGALNVANGVTTTINKTRATATGTAGATTLTVNSSTGFAAGQNVLIHQTQGTNAGNWETATVTAVANGSLTLAVGLKNAYSTKNGDAAQVIVIPQYTDVTVTGTLNAPAWDGSTGGILVLQANGAATISGTVSMDATGFRGTKHACTYQCTDGVAGESSTGAGAAGNTANGAGGGGGQKGQDCGAGGGGSYGTAGTVGAQGTVGTCSNNPHLSGDAGAVVGGQDLSASIFMGAAGGEGGGDEDGAFPGQGGTGGGIIVLLTQTITISGTVTTVGAVGLGGNSVDCGAAGCGMGGGGGGSGGAVRVVAATATLGANKIVATGGIGGDCTCGGVLGGSGGVGRVAVKSPNLTGTTNPALFSG